MNVNHSRFVALTRLGKTASEIKKMLGWRTNKEIEGFSGLADSDPKLTLDISKSSKVRNGKYAAYLHSDKEVILLNSAHFYFIAEPLDGEIKVLK